MFNCTQLSTGRNDTDQGNFIGLHTYILHFLKILQCLFWSGILGITSDHCRPCHHILQRQIIKQTTSRFHIPILRIRNNQFSPRNHISLRHFIEHLPRATQEPTFHIQINHRITYIQIRRKSPNQNRLGMHLLTQIHIKRSPTSLKKRRKRKRNRTDAIPPHSSIEVSRFRHESLKRVSTNHGSPKKGVGVINLSKNQKWVGTHGDIYLREHADEFGEDVRTLTQSVADDMAMDLLDLRKERAVVKNTHESPF
ncbi:hypothetical protein IC582_017039 [Cucumis melo]